MKDLMVSCKERENIRQLLSTGKWNIQLNAAIPSPSNSNYGSNSNQDRKFNRPPGETPSPRRLQYPAINLMMANNPMEEDITMTQRPLRHNNSPKRGRSPSSKNKKNEIWMQIPYVSPDRYDDNNNNSSNDTLHIDNAYVKNSTHENVGIIQINHSDNQWTPKTLTIHDFNS